MDGNIFSKTTDGVTTYPSNHTNMPMYGTISNNSIEFKHIGGLAVIRVDKMPAESGTLTVTADQQLSGDFKVSSQFSIATASTETDADKTVTFTFSGATADGVGVFYLPLATGDYTNLNVNINGTEVDCGSVTISRAGVTAIAIAKYTGSVSSYTGKLLRSYGSDKYYLGSNKYLINDREFVDLGLSVLWATMNVGADSETAYGTYCASIDAATQACTTWASSCSVPTKENFDELLTCTVEETAQNTIYRDYKFTSKSNGSSILLPSTGYQSNGYTVGKTFSAYYWSSTTYTESNWMWTQTKTHALYWPDNASPYLSGIGGLTNYSCPVRAVAAKP